jgi:hypothetical protein
MLGTNAYCIDLAYRDDLLRILVQALSEFFEIDVPDLPAEQLLCIETEA